MLRMDNTVGEVILTSRQSKVELIKTLGNGQKIDLKSMGHSLAYTTHAQPGDLFIFQDILLR